MARLNGDLVLFTPVRNGQTFSISVFTFPSQFYRLEFRDFLDRSNWTASPWVMGDGTIKTLIDLQTGDAPRFYRVRAE